MEDLEKTHKKSTNKLLIQQNSDPIGSLNKQTMGQPKIKKPQIYFPKSNQNHYKEDERTETEERSNKNNIRN